MDEARPPPEAAADSDEYMPTFSPARSALLWNTLNLGFGLLSSLGVPVLQIRYEDFVADPPRSLAELAEFACGPEDLSEAIARFLARDRASLGRSHTASGNPMRFDTGSIAFRADQTWRKALHPWDRAVVSALTLPLLARYGYLRRRRPPPSPAWPSPRPRGQIPRPRLCRARTSASGLIRPAITATARYGRGSRGLARIDRRTHLQAVTRSPQAAAAKAIRPARRA